MCFFRRSIMGNIVANMKEPFSAIHIEIVLYNNDCEYTYYLISMLCPGNPTLSKL
jgi:hypothetical protein